VPKPTSRSRHDILATVSACVRVFESNRFSRRSGLQISTKHFTVYCTVINNYDSIVIHTSDTIPAAVMYVKDLMGVQLSSHPKFDLKMLYFVVTSPFRRI